MARYVCERCGTEYHVVGGLIDGKDTEHICKDLKARWAKREKMKAVVLEVLNAHYQFYLDEYEFEKTGDYHESVAEEIVMSLVKLNPTEDI